MTDLFNVYIALLDWRHAEELLPSIVRDLGGNPAKLMARIAATAAKAEAKADAVRLWRQVINLCPMEFEHLDELVQSGLRDELVRLYRDLARQMSNSQAPSCALKLLHAN
ncbi:MAG: hypothetical protein NTY53_01105 [Kiritimatiellaeota bacterium]|nr:hypothetical protein [Kiritimatiellota bacterium]